VRGTVGWLDKVKVDQRAIGANLAVIVSTALPDGMVEFGRVPPLSLPRMRWRVREGVDGD
jgi:hypothetical protein